jgi:hypothetical protein
MGLKGTLRDRPTVEFKTEGLIFVSGLSRTHTGVWSRCKVVKPFTCKISGKPFESGVTAYRPLTNTKNRMHRIAVSSVLDLISGDSESLIKVIHDSKSPAARSLHLGE